METKYYYLRNKSNSKPLVTVCLVKKDNEIGKGVLICSLKDNPDKKFARKKALGRALKAIGTKKDTEPILLSKAMKVLCEVEDDTNTETNFIWVHPHKSIYNPNLTPFERRLLKVGV